MKGEENLYNLFQKFNYTEDEKELIKAIESAKRQWEEAKMYFQLIDDPNLVDYAIYKEDAAKSRYMYLLNDAKSKEIRVNPYIIKDNSNAG
ncbi:YaaL family protein [Haloimpatiens sp. FM7315]|uniref:YaaL family protein n=1 Tax=Haloimpatiens sp. FM7315 TaxID=3298609 RepID=UPI0035A31225